MHHDRDPEVPTEDVECCPGRPQRCQRDHSFECLGERGGGLGREGGQQGGSNLRTRARSVNPARGTADGSGTRARACAPPPPPSSLSPPSDLMMEAEENTREGHGGAPEAPDGRGPSLVPHALKLLWQHAARRLRPHLRRAARRRPPNDPTKRGGASKAGGAVTGLGAGAAGPSAVATWLAATLCRPQAAAIAGGALPAAELW